jgi:hypothetical protein
MPEARSARLKRIRILAWALTLLALLILLVSAYIRLSGAAEDVDEAGPDPVRVGTEYANQGKHDHQRQQRRGMARGRLDRAGAQALRDEDEAEYQCQRGDAAMQDARRAALQLGRTGQ